MFKTYKIISVALMILLAIPLMAQDITTQGKSKNDIEYLPKAGNLSFGVSTNPLTSFARVTEGYNLGRTGLLPYATPTVSIMGKYMMQDNLAIKVSLGLIASGGNSPYYVVDDKAINLDPLSEAKVTDWEKTLTHGGSVSFGLEYRIGKGRVQGVFSGSALYSWGMTSSEYSYGNAITEINQKPTISNSWNTSISPAIPDARRLKTFSTSNFHSAGLVGSVGIEWFVAPKISLGAEVNLALIYTWTPASYVEVEGYSTLSQKVENYTDLLAPSSSNFFVGSQNIGSNLSLNFYF